MSTSPLVKGAHSVGVKTPMIEKRNPTIDDFKFRSGLPTAAELPDSDDKPVDSELQELIPGLLKAILLDIWRDRSNWLFAIDMGLYYDPDLPAIAPDGFLSLGVKEPEDENLRSSYVLWDELVIPLLAVEVVSKAYRKEHTKKLEIYHSIGVLYYIVYAPLRKRKARFQVYKMIEGEYVLQSEGGESYWMPEIGLGIGVEKQIYCGRLREWLYWYDENGVRYPNPTERAEAEAGRAEAEARRAEVEAAARRVAEQRSNLLMERLREMGIDPQTILGETVEPSD
jgi:Uma2 family endonuclease